MQLDSPPDPTLGMAVPAANVRSILRGIPVSICKRAVLVLLQVQNDQQVDLGWLEKLSDHFPRRGLPPCVLVYGTVRSCVPCHHQRACLCCCVCSDQRHQGLESVPHRLFMPNLIGGIVLGYIWLMIFDGILSNYNTAVVLETKYGFWGLIILMCWQQIGYMMIIYIAGLQAIPEDMLEAAKIDGASSWKTLWHITIPNVMPSITICTFLSLTNGFKLYDQNLALTGGSPFRTLADGNVIKTTEMLALNIVNSNTSNSKGPGQAKAVIFFVLVAIISVAQLIATRKKEVDQ